MPSFGKGGQKDRICGVGVDRPGGNHEGDRQRRAGHDEFAEHRSVVHLGGGASNLFRHFLLNRLNCGVEGGGEASGSQRLDSLIPGVLRIRVERRGLGAPMRRSEVADQLLDEWNDARRVARAVTPANRP
jgi:hypothetical protein